MRKILATCLTILIGLNFINNVYTQEVEDMKAVMIIASSDFRDEELFETREVLEGGGVEIAVASSSLSPSRGKLGKVAKPDILLGDIKVADYDAVIFVGGPGAEEYFNDSVAHKVAKDTVSAGKVLGAICIAPVTLANAGVLKGKRATVFFSGGGDLKAKGAKYTAGDVEVDGNIVTANGPQAAGNFGRAILELLKKK